MIELEDVSKYFGLTKALDHISFKAERGRVLGFLGANGAGKTTTLDIISGCMGADLGKVSIGGHDILEEPIRAKEKIGYLPDEAPLHNDMSVISYIRFVGELRGLSGAQLAKRVDQTLEQLDLGSVRRKLIAHLSKGYRQRVGLAQAIVHSPEVLILDEPTEGLDPNHIIQIRDLIKSFKGSHTIILSSHILSEVESICDDVVIIDKGKIQAQGSLEELKSALHKPALYTLKVARKGDELGAQLKTLNFVSIEDQLSEDTYRFSLNESQEDLDLVLKLCVEGNYGLRELSHTKNNLEDIFFQFTREAQN